jgi:signal transduction histidine kinase
MIHGYAHLLMRIPSDTTKIERYCQSILSGVDQMTEMTNELLEFAKGNYNPSFNRYLISDFIEEIINSLKLTFRQQNVGLETKLDYSGEIVFNGEEMRRVFVNLAINALEAMPDGGTCYISTRSDENGVEFLVRDTGKGIPTDIIDTIFESFVTYDKEGGTGLGLAIVKSIIDYHQGRIWVESERDRGTTFHFTIPHKLALNERKGGVGMKRHKPLLVSNEIPRLGLVTINCLARRVKNSISVQRRWS